MADDRSLLLLLTSKKSKWKKTLSCLAEHNSLRCIRIRSGSKEQVCYQVSFFYTATKRYYFVIENIGGFIYLTIKMNNAKIFVWMCTKFDVPWQSTSTFADFLNSLTRMQIQINKTDLLWANGNYWILSNGAAFTVDLNWCINNWLNNNNWRAVKTTTTDTMALSKSLQRITNEQKK